MSRTPREIEHAFNRVRYESFIEDLRRSWGMLAFIIAAIAFMGYYVMTPHSPAERVYGAAIGAYLPATDDNSALLRIAVRFDDGRIINVRAPRTTPYLEGAMVEVEATRRQWPPHSSRYRFTHYVEDAPTANP